jgi:hypothetical protein
MNIISIDNQLDNSNDNQFDDQNDNQLDNSNDNQLDNSPSLIYQYDTPVVVKLETHDLFKKFAQLQKTDFTSIKILDKYNYQSQLKTLTYFINKYKNEPKQRTLQWHAARKNTIGGSEIGSVLGAKDAFINYTQLLNSKISPESKFMGNRHTRFGVLFENVTHEFAVNRFKIKHIYTDLNVPGSIDGIRYSPDGIGLIDIIINNKKITLIILFEYKSPSSNISNYIKDSYMCQIQTGLICTPADFGIFITNVYRITSLKNFGFNPLYNKTLCNKQVYACGVIAFYQTKENYYNTVIRFRHMDNSKEKFINEKLTIKNEKGHTVLNKDKYPFLNFNHINKIIEDDKLSNINNFIIDEQILVMSKDDPIDFGASNNYEMFERLFILHEEKILEASYSKIIYNEKACDNINIIGKLNNNSIRIDTASELEDIMEKFNELSDSKSSNNSSDKILVGYLPYKLFKSDIFLIDKDPDWKKKIHPHVDAFINSIKYDESTNLVIDDNVLTDKDKLESMMFNMM